MSLGLALVSAVAFVQIADEVMGGDARAFDLRVAESVAGWDLPGLDAAMRVVTPLGSFVATFLASLAVAGWALWRRSRALACVVVAVALTTEALNYALKAIFRRERPELVDIVPLTHYAFPSGHAMVSTAVYGTLAIAVARLRPSLALLVYVTTVVLVLAIGLSRIVLGVHWATDVLAGFAAGAIVLGAAKLAMGRPHDPGGVVVPAATAS